MPLLAGIAEAWSSNSAPAKRVQVQCNVQAAVSRHHQDKVLRTHLVPGKVFWEVLLSRLKQHCQVTPVNGLQAHTGCLLHQEPVAAICGPSLDDQPSKKGRHAMLSTLQSKLQHLLQQCMPCDLAAHQCQASSMYSGGKATSQDCQSNTLQLIKRPAKTSPRSALAIALQTALT